MTDEPSWMIHTPGPLRPLKAFASHPQSDERDKPNFNSPLRQSAFIGHVLAETCLTARFTQNIRMAARAFSSRDKPENQDIPSIPHEHTQRWSDLAELSLMGAAIWRHRKTSQPADHTRRTRAIRQTGFAFSLSGYPKTVTLKRRAAEPQAMWPEASVLKLRSFGFSPQRGSPKSA